MEQLAIVAALLAAGVMFGLDSDLTTRDFTAVLHRPGPLGGGMVVLPTLAHTLVMWVTAAPFVPWARHPRGLTPAAVPAGVA